MTPEQAKQKKIQKGYALEPVFGQPTLEDENLPEKRERKKSNIYGTSSVVPPIMTANGVWADARKHVQGTVLHRIMPCSRHCQRGSPLRRGLRARSRSPTTAAAPRMVPRRGHHRWCSSSRWRFLTVRGLRREGFCRCVCILKSAFVPPDFQGSGHDSFPVDRRTD